MSKLNHYNQDGEGNNFKLVTRAELFSRVEGKAKKILLMPSAKCPDLKVGVEMGKIDREKTEIHVYEIIPNVMNQIKKVCTGLKLKNVKYFQQDILTVQELDYDYDLIYLDLCGPMTQNIFHFIRRNHEQLNLCPIVAMTFEILCRNTKMRRIFPEVTKFPKFIKQPMWLGDADSANCEETKTTYNAQWTISIVLKALGIPARRPSIDFCMAYNAGTPMVTFMFNKYKNNIKHDLIPLRKWAKTAQLEKIERINNPVPIQTINGETLEELQAEYDRLCSLPKNHANAGLKRSITCKMQKLQLV